MGQRVLGYLLLAPLAVLAMVILGDLHEIWSDPSSYRFGTELHAWRYGSRARYLTTSLVELALCVAGVIVPELHWRAGRRASGVLLRALALIGLCAMIRLL